MSMHTNAVCKLHTDPKSNADPDSMSRLHTYADANSERNAD